MLLTEQSESEFSKVFFIFQIGKFIWKKQVINFALGMSFVSVEGFSTDVVFVAVYHLFVVRNIVIIRKRVK